MDNNTALPFFFFSFFLKTFPIVTHTTDLTRAPWEKERRTTLIYTSIVRHVLILEMSNRMKRRIDPKI